MIHFFMAVLTIGCMAGFGVLLALWLAYMWRVLQEWYTQAQDPRVRILAETLAASQVIVKGYARWLVVGRLPTGAQLEAYTDLKAKVCLLEVDGLPLSLVLSPRAVRYLTRIARLRCQWYHEVCESQTRRSAQLDFDRLLPPPPAHTGRY